MHSAQLITSPFSKSHGSERFAVRAPFITVPVTPARSSDSPRFPKPWPPIASVRSSVVVMMKVESSSHTPV